MVRLQRDSKGQILSLSDQAVLAVGGEARIYEVPGNPALVAKLYHKPSLERASKLRVMVANPPSDPMAVQKHTSIAWPTDLLHLPGQPQRTVGFLMPRVVGMRRVIDFFNPKTRREQCPLFNYFYLHRTARNLAIAVRAIHERGYVIGDINESNVLVSDRALVTLVDTDSFQVWDMGKGRMYRCRVGKPEFTPPELQGRCFADLDRETYHDLFGMGVILFQLLMEGTHPFAGAYKGPGDPPPYEQRIGAGHFPHSVTAHVPYSPGPIAPHFAWLHPMLQHLFGRCFQEGHLDPTLRPDTQSWQWALEEAEKALVSCWVNDQHIYSSHLEVCPWCERAKLLDGRDPFPSVKAVKQGAHLRPAPRKRQTRPQRQSWIPPLNPPIPRPIPISRWPARTRPVLPQAGKIRSAWNSFRPQNNWAWVGLMSGVMGIAGMLIAWGPHLPRGIYWWGIIATGLGIIGEVIARRPEYSGRGKWVARLAIGLGLGTSGLYLKWFITSF